MLLDLHHIQLAMPEGGEAEAEAFYAGALGLSVVAKPAALAGRGGLWLERGALRVHLGVETPFAPAKKAHPAFRVDSLRMAEDALAGAGVGFTRDVDLPGLRRIFVADPFGNRIELVETCG